MVPSLPPLRVIRSETDSNRDSDSGDRYHHEQQQHLSSQFDTAPLPLPAPSTLARVSARRHEQVPMDVSALYSRFAPTALHHGQHDPHQQPRAAAVPTSTIGAATAAWRHIQAEDSGVYEHHREQLRSLGLHHHHRYVARHSQHEHEHLSSFSRHRSAPTSASGSFDRTIYRPALLDVDDDDDDETEDGDEVSDERRRQQQHRGSSERAGAWQNGRRGGRDRESLGALDAAAGRSTVSSQDALGDSPSNSSSSAFDPALSKKARRKEQCRVNQANYRKRKRMYENELSGQIKTLEQEIADLHARKVALHGQSDADLDATSASEQEYSHHHHRHIAPDTGDFVAPDPIQSIGDFYYAIECARFEEPHSVQLDYPSLHSLFQLQQQEFSSIHALRLQWLWYREQFDVFNLFVSSSERLDAGDQVIIRISAHLHIQVPMRRHLAHKDEYAGDSKSDDLNSSGTDWVAKRLVCPVLQQFEFHVHERVLTQITSEIDWTAGVAALVQQQPEHTLLLLQELVDEVATRWCC